MTDTDTGSNGPENPPRYHSRAEREAAQRAARDAEHDALSQRIQVSRASANRHEREGSQRRQLADIQAFRALMLDALEHPLAKTKSPWSGSFASFKSVCALIRQRSAEDPSFLTPDLCKSLPFFYKMVTTPAAWIKVADRLADHTRSGLTREITALGPFAGLRVSIRSILVSAGINDVVQLGAAIASGSIALDHDISSNGLTRRRWAELLEWIEQKHSAFVRRTVKSVCHPSKSFFEGMLIRSGILMKNRISVITATFSAPIILQRTIDSMLALPRLQFFWTQIWGKT
jgi:hypothetical protein